MILNPLLTAVLITTFLKLTTSDGSISWDPAISSFETETDDQTKKRMKSGMPRRISQFGGDSMLDSSFVQHENDRNVNDDGKESDIKYMEPGFRSQDYEYRYNEPVKHMTHGAHHANRRHYFKKNLHENFANDFQLPSMLRSGRTRRNEEKDNVTQNSSTPLHHETQTGKPQKQNEEHSKHGTKKPCIKSHPYKIISSHISNVTHNNTETTTSIISPHTSNVTHKNTESTTSRTNDLTTTPTVSPLSTAHNGSVTTPPIDRNSTISKGGNEKTTQGENPSASNPTIDNNQAGKSAGQKFEGFGLPCDINGQWVSEAGGVLLTIKSNQDKGHLDVEVHDMSPVKKGFLSPSWKITGNHPFNYTGSHIGGADTTAASQTKIQGGPIILSATVLNDQSDNSEQKVAVFLGECRVCYEGVESVIGSWNLKRLSKDCMDASLSQQDIRDILHRERTLATAGEQPKPEGSNETKPKDSSDHSKNKHLFRRRRYGNAGKHRRMVRNGLRHHSVKVE